MSDIADFDSDNSIYNPDFVCEEILPSCEQNISNYLSKTSSGTQDLFINEELIGVNKILFSEEFFKIVQEILAFQSESYPATSTDATTHIVSYVHQRKLQKHQQLKGPKHNEFEEFDFENFRSNLTKDMPEMLGALQQLFGRFVENFETNLGQLDNNVVPKNENYKESKKGNEMPSVQVSDDLMDYQMNTLENGFGDNEQHESPKNETMWQRSKQSIPVLESVRHLVNSVRDGHLNHTEHVQRHRTLLSEMQPKNDQNTSMAIETEEEREMINGSSDLQFLEVLGSIGSKVWGFLSNIKQVFAASAGSASAALSGSSSSSSS